MPEPALTDQIIIEATMPQLVSVVAQVVQTVEVDVSLTQVVTKAVQR